MRCKSSKMCVCMYKKTPIKYIHMYVCTYDTNVL